MCACCRCVYPPPTEAPEVDDSHLTEAQSGNGLHGFDLSRESFVHMSYVLCAYPVPFVQQCANLAGYGKLPDGFACAFVGGWLFAIGSMLSLFYACAIALNTQLVFVHGRTPRDGK